MTPSLSPPSHLPQVVEELLCYEWRYKPTLEILWGNNENEGSKVSIFPMVTFAHGNKEKCRNKNVIPFPKTPLCYEVTDDDGFTHIVYYN